MIPIKGAETISKAQLLAFARGKGAHQRYIDVLDLYASLGPIFGLRWGGAYIQAGKETGWGHYTGVLGPETHNWCGLKTATGGSNTDPKAHMTFATDGDGVRAHLFHLSAYAGIGPPSQLANNDPRYRLVAFGSAPNFAQLGGKWAPAANYGTDIESLITAAAASAGGSAPVAIVGRDPVAEWQPSSNFTSRRNNLAVSHITNHLTMGTDSLAWLRGQAGGSSNRDSSAHYLIRRDGHPFQLIDERDTPWSDGNLFYNRTGISIEHESADGTFTEAQILSSIALQARIAIRQGWGSVKHPEGVQPENGPQGQIIGHAQVPSENNPAAGGGNSGHVGCPGKNFPYQRVVDGVNAALKTGATMVTVADHQYFDQTKHTISGGFYQYWLHHGGLAEFGFPISDEWAVTPDMNLGDAKRVQYFERARFEWHPGLDPANWDVQLGRLGALDLAILDYVKSLKDDDPYKAALIKVIAQAV